VPTLFAGKITSKYRMKIVISFTRAGLAAAIALASFGARAQSSFTNLHSFDGTNGGYPYAVMVLGGGTLFGTTESGGTGGANAGTVFAINLNGTGFTNLCEFPRTLSGNDSPIGGLALSGNMLYGGLRNSGSVFGVNTNGTGFTNFPGFGGDPEADLLVAGNTLYGTTYNGDAVFAYNINNLTFSNVYSFTGTQGNQGTNSDGSSPSGGLVLTGGSFYGSAENGGRAGRGTIYKVDTDGSNFVTLHSFTLGTYDPALQQNTNSDGANPYGTLALSGTTLYGTTSAGGIANNGTVFSISTSGNNFTVLHTFSPVADSTAPAFEAVTNGDGATPYGDLLLSGGVLYGTTYSGGIFGEGTVFAINTDGSGFTNLYNFSGTFGEFGTNSDGAGPRGGLVLSGNTLYGTTDGGGQYGYGTVFAVSLAPAQVPLKVQPMSGALVMTWSNASYYLEAAPTVNGVYTPLSDSPSPSTNSLTGAQQYFRLRAN
jgi:uncharacterized repeat protein (TIGR03803 family)